MWARNRARQWLKICAVMIAALWLGACSGKDKADETIIATYQGGTITQSEFEEYKGTLQLLNPMFALFQEDPEFNKEVLHQYIALKVISGQADAKETKTIEKAASEEVNLLRQIIQSQGGEQEWENRLKENGTSEEAVKRYFYLSKVSAEQLGKKINEQQIEAEYDRRLEEDAHFFDVASVSHILIATDVGGDEGDERTKEEALEIAQEVKAKLDQGEDFAQVAQDYSDDTSTAANGGKIPEMAVNQFAQLSPEFKQAVIELPVGETSEPIEFEFGYHIIKVDTRRTLQFAEARNQLRAELIGEQLREFIEREVPELVEKIEIPDV